jgi:transporter family protein
MTLAYLALLGRIILVGYERIVVKQLGQRSNSVGAAFLFFAIATLFLLPFMLFAFTKIDVSVAEPASMLGMIATVILARLVFREKIGRRLVAVIVMIAGAWLLLCA